MSGEWPRSDAPAIELKEAAVRYQNLERPTLDRMTLTIERGETVGVVGPTGSGKTTFLHLLGGVVPHYNSADISGVVRIFGEESTKLSLRRLTAHIGLVLQDPEAQLFNLLVRDEIVWGLENRGLKRDEMHRRLLEGLELFGIQHLVERVTHDLSGGEKQRVALAAIFALHPSMVLFDDPTSQLDPVGAASVITAIRQLAATGDVTIVVVEDNLDELAHHVERMLILGERTLSFDGSPQQFCKERDLRSRIGVAAPQVTELAHRLRDRGVQIPGDPLTVDEASELFSGSLVDQTVTNRPRHDHTARASTDTAPEKVAVADQVSYTYPPPRRVHALHPLTVEFAAGEFAAIVGPNGSGKTTLSKCLSGHLEPTEGRVLVPDIDISRLTPSQRVTRVGYVFQNPDHQLFGQSVWDEVAFGLHNVGLTEPRLSQRVDQVLDSVGLTNRAGDHPFRLSRGDRQRLAVAAVAVLRPRMLIVDEPTTGLDPVRARELLELLKGLNREHRTTVVIVSHAMDLVAEYAGRTIVMAQGGILLDGPTREVFAQPEIISAASVTPPPVARLALHLGINPPPVTLSDATDVIASRMVS